MATEFKNKMREVMRMAWQMVKKNGYTMSEALKTAWLNMKLKASMKERIVKFYLQKVDGSIREAYGTLKESLLPPNKGTESRKRSETVSVLRYEEKRIQVI